MRWDMKEVLVETARVGGGRDKGGRRAYEREKANGFEDSPIREKMRRRKTKSQGDKLGPLHDFLMKKVGQRWDDVFREICEVNDKRSMLGFHLLTHLQQYVMAPGLRYPYTYSEPDFHVVDGILWKTRKNRRNHFLLSRLTDPIEHFPLENGWRFRKVDGQWYRMKEEEIPDTYVAHEYIDEAKYEIVRVIKPTTRTKHWKFQCNKKEMRRVRQLVAAEIVKRRRAYARALGK